MKFNLMCINKDEWKEVSEAAHFNIFGVNRSADHQRIDFCLLLQNTERNDFFGYITCREFDSKTLYWSYGGMFDQYKGTTFTFSAIWTMLNWCRERYDRVTTLVEQSNVKMQRIHLKLGAVISGVRTFDNEIIIELTYNFSRGGN